MSRRIRGMWQRHGPCALGVLAILIGGCNKNDGPPQGGATPDPNEPVQMNISGQQPVVLGPDNIQAEIDKAGSGVKLVKIDLSPAGLPLTMDAPEGAKVQKDNLDVQVVAEDRFAVRFKLGKRPFQWKKQKLGGQK